MLTDLILGGAIILAIIVGIFGSIAGLTIIAFDWLTRRK